MKPLIAIVLGAALIAATANLIAGAVIAVSIWPVVTNAGGSTQLRIFVERNDQNRELRWEVDGPDYYRSSTKQVDGSQSPQNYTFLVKNLPEGEFSVRAIVRRADNSEALAQTTVVVLPGAKH